MHEMGITQSILATAFEVAEERGATRIREIHVRVGELTEIVEVALQFAFESLAPGTLAEGGTLVVEIVAPRSRCTLCGTEFDHGRFDAICPECENPFNEAITGRELLITAIEVDLPDDAEPGGDDAPEPAADASRPA